MLNLPNSVFPGLESQESVASQVALESVALELVGSVLEPCFQELLGNLPSQVLALGGCSQGLEFRALACHRYFQVGLLASWDSVGSPPRPSEEPWVPWALEAAWAAHKGSTVGGSGSNRPPVIDDLMNFGATAWSRM